AARPGAAPPTGLNGLGPTRPDPTVTRIAASSHRRTLTHIRRVIGHSDQPMHSYFARLAPSAVLDLVHQAQLHWLAQAVAGTEAAGLPLISAASPCKVGGRGGPDYFTDIPAGPIALRHVSDLYMFPNMIRALVLPGHLLRDWLEWSAAQFCQLTPGTANQPLLNAHTPAYNFDTFSGLTYQIDLRSPARTVPADKSVPGRIRDLCHAGKPIEDEDRFAVVTNNFRASGGGGFDPLATVRPLDTPSQLTRDCLVDFILSRPTLQPRAGHHWQLAPLPPGTGGWFDTGPGARAHKDEMTALGIRPLNVTADGFLRCCWLAAQSQPHPGTTTPLQSTAQPSI
ncbi:MAG: 5'-nucleotidase C-terminal domain-containing protein, partial [Rhodobacteraceae bacterium]|nr:5'-nucleotidase C-terminal domain-containing protein [Paracoccaceae bacterium]